MNEDEPKLTYSARGQRSEGVGNPLIYWITRLTCVFYYKLGGIKIYGRDNIPETGRFILAPNHISHIDPPLVSIYSPRRPHTLAKSSLFKPALFGIWNRGLGAFPIERGKADRKAIRHAMKLLEGGAGLMIFPEGTRSTDGEIHQAEVGLGMIAHSTKTPIIPVYIRGSDKALSRLHPRPRLTPLELHYGKPLLFEEEYATRGGRVVLEAIGQRVMDEIIAMRDRCIEREK